MAELNKQMFGNLKGKFGKAVFRQRNGKNYIAQRPDSYTTPSTEAFQKRTNKFRLTSKIAAVINSVPVLKEIWLDTTPNDLSPYNYLISVNYQAVNGDTISGLLKIVPESKVGVRLDTMTLTADKLSIKLLPLTAASLIDPALEKKVQSVSIIFLSNPLSEDVEKFEVIPLLSSSKIFDLENALTFDCNISTALEEKIAKYGNKNIYTTLITYNENDAVVNYSGTFSFVIV